MAATTGASPNEQGRSSKKGAVWRDWSERGAKLSLPILTTVVSAVLIANFVTSRQDMARERRNQELQTKAQIAEDMSTLAAKAIADAENRFTHTYYLTRAAALEGKGSLLPDPYLASVVGDFTASATLVRAKLEAYYSDPALATAWEHYSRAVEDYVAYSASSFKDLNSTFEDYALGMRKIVGKKALSNDDWFALEAPARAPGRWAIYAFRHLGDFLIARDAELTRKALR